MRRFLVVAPVLAALALPTAAAAKDRAIERDAQQIARIANDPETQHAVAQSLSTLLNALMDVKIGPMVKAMEGVDPKGRKMRGVDADTTIGDMAAKQDRNYQAKLDRGIDQSTKAMGAVATGLAAMLPSLLDAMDQVKAQTKDIKLPKGVGKELSRDLDRMVDAPAADTTS